MTHWHKGCYDFTVSHSVRMCFHLLLSTWASSLLQWFSSLFKNVQPLYSICSFSLFFFFLPSSAYNQMIKISYTVSPYGKVLLKNPYKRECLWDLIVMLPLFLVCLFTHAQ